MQNEKEIRYIDLFGGVGGFRLGIERATQNNGSKSNLSRGWEKNSRSPQNLQSNRNNSCPQTSTTCVWYNDIDKYAVQTYNKNFGENYEAKDIRTIKTSEIPDFDFLCGGFPCQAFSIAGKKRGFQDTRGTLFFEIARIIKAKRPKIMLLENVKGLLNHDKGQTFSIILQTLDELGYETQWMVLNSKFFGVPQNRERVFIIGNKRGTSRPEILPFGESSSEFNEEKKLKWGGRDIVFNITKSSGAKQPIPEAKRVYEIDGISPPNKSHPTLIHNVYGGFGEEKMREFTEHSPTIRTPRGGGHIPMVVVDPLNMRREGKPRIYKDTCPTLNSRDYKEPRIVDDGIKIRRLTPIECERLQGFPDNWTEGVSDTQRYKQMGNAVTVNVVQAIIERMFK